MSLLRSAVRYAWRRIDNYLTAGIFPEPAELYRFRSQADVDRWRVFTDATFGGKSVAGLQLGSDGKSAVFSGIYSKAIEDATHLIRSGYCGINQVRPRNINLTMHDFLELRIKGDGHTYIASMRVDQLTGGDEEAWQAPLPTKNDGQWSNVRLDLDDFIFSFRGRLVRQPGAVGNMPRDKVMSFGITLSASDDMPPEGNFRLEIESITAGAHEASGTSALRKAYRGDCIIRPDPMYDRPRPEEQMVQQHGEPVLGGRGLLKQSTAASSQGTDGK